MVSLSLLNFNPTLKLVEPLIQQEQFIAALQQTSKKNVTPEFFKVN